MDHQRTDFRFHEHSLTAAVEGLAAVVATPNALAGDADVDSVGDWHR